MTKIKSATSIEVILLMILLIFIITSLFGFAFFAMRPENLWDYPFAQKIFSQTFAFFSQAQVLLSLSLFSVFLWRKMQSSWLKLLALTYLLSFTSEFVGTSYGIPFGNYGYTDFLGFKLGGQVPYTIPLSWFFMAYPSYLIFSYLFPQSNAFLRIIMSALLLTIWDIVLDPAMSYLTNYWYWGESGPFYGMPLINFFGWFLTGVVICSGFELLKAPRLTEQKDFQWLTIFYGLNVLLPLGMCLAGGLWDAILYFFLSLVLFLGLTYGLRNLSLDSAVKNPLA